MAYGLRYVADLSVLRASLLLVSSFMLIRLLESNRQPGAIIHRKTTNKIGLCAMTDSQLVFVLAEYMFGFFSPPPGYMLKFIYIYIYIYIFGY